MVNTGFFKSGGNRLSYVCVMPQGQAKKTGVMFIHPIGGNRLGPHRMFVELANRYGSLKYPTFRFDLRGCGDSTGTLQINMENEIYDVVEAAGFFINMANLEGLILLGISRGACICFNSAILHNLPLLGMILLSTPVSSNKTAVKSFSFKLKYYLCKLKDLKYFRKFLSGQPNIAHIVKILITTLRSGKRYDKIKTNMFRSKCPVLFIYGGGDPIATESRQYYTNKCMENDLPHECHIIKGANHAFFHYKWKEQIFNVSEKWLAHVSN